MSCGSERPASGVDRFGVDVAVVADHGRRGGHLLGRGAVGEHVSPRHQRELGRGEQPVPDHELVGRTRPGRRGGAIHVDAGAAGGDEHHVALAGGDQGGGIEDGGDTHLRGAPGAGPEAQFEGDAGAVRADDTVDVVRGDAGVGQRTQRTEERNGGRVVLGQDASLHRVVDADDGDAGEGMARHGAYSRITTRRPRTVCVGPAAPFSDAAPGLACATAGRVPVRTAGLRGLGKA